MIGGLLALLVVLTAVLVPGRSQAPLDAYAAHISSAGPRSSEDERNAFHLPPRDTVRIRDDTTGNGLADKVTTFPRGLTLG